MVSIENLSVEFAARPLFSGVNCIINNRDRIALVGKNGAGKSTMLKIIAGQQQPTSGCVTLPHDITVGYLPQVMVLADGRTVREEAMTAFSAVTELEKRVERLSREMAERTDYESESYMELCERFTHESERLAMMGGAGVDAELERTLTGLGFEREELDRPTCEFSGGWRMRIELAKLLLQNPDVLLLDEPTNHLDIESIQWLEQFLSARSGAVVLVSHDRAFINNVTNRTLEISCGRVIDYRVKYDEYVRLRAERREQQLRAYENQQKEIADTKAFIERFRYQATKAVQVQQRIRQLEKTVPVEIDEIDNAQMHLKFPPCTRSGDFPVICEDVEKTYPLRISSVPEAEKKVFSNVNLTIRRGEKVAFVGRNGEGKTTLVKCIMGEIPFGGTLKVGHNIQIGYFAQNQAQLLDGELTVFDTIDRVAVGDIRTKIRDLLGAFMFGGEAIDKKVKVLSGGERTRLAMIRLLLTPVNMLILDEPTNHLDMKSKDVLKEAVRAFSGTVIVVSHDREFLDGLVDKVYEFGGGRVREHIGGIYDFLRKRGLATLRQLEAAAPQSAAADNAKSETPASSARAAYEQKKEEARQRRKLEKAVAEAEDKVSKLEQSLHELEDELAANPCADLIRQHADLKSQLSQAEAEWEEAMMRMEE